MARYTWGYAPPARTRGERPHLLTVRAAGYGSTDCGHIIAADSRDAVLYVDADTHEVSCSMACARRLHARLRAEVES